MIEKYRKQNGTYKYEMDGCSYENAKDLIQTGLFEFCGCGNPLGNLEYIRDSLRLLLMKHDETKEPWDVFYARYRKACTDHFKSEQAETFMWYWLDSKGYTEHGGSIPGWQTKEGEEIMEDIEIALKEAEREA